MKQLLGRNVLYLSKEMMEVDTTQTKFFPFLSSSMIASTASQQIIVKNIHAIGNWPSIKNIVPHAQKHQEFVFFGRSNVGKSTLINKIVRSDSVQTSKKPGKTKQLIFLKVKFPFDTLLVDAPGYGFASDASKQQIMNWGRLIEYYLKNSPKLDDQLIMVLVDILHGLKETDGMLLDMLKKSNKPFMLVYTKCDRAKEEDMKRAVEQAKQMQAAFVHMFNYVHFTSAKTEEGIFQLRSHILYRLAAKMCMEGQDKIPNK